MDAPNALRAQAFVRSPEEARRPQDVLALVGQKQIGGAYAEATVALAGTGKADDQALSAEVLTPSGAIPMAPIVRQTHRAAPLLQAATVVRGWCIASARRFSARAVSSNARFTQPCVKFITWIAFSPKKASVD